MPDGKLHCAIQYSPVPCSRNLKPKYTQPSRIIRPQTSVLYVTLDEKVLSFSTGHSGADHFLLTGRVNQ